MMYGRASRSSRSPSSPAAAVRLTAVSSLVVLLVAAGLARAASPADERRQLIAKAVSDLAATQPDTREQARQTLFGLNRQDLATLRTIVQQRLPLSAAEMEPLRDVVTHVYLRDESYASDNEVGFVGVVFDRDQGPADPELGGVEIRRRIPGFCGYRYLEDGDVILAVGLSPRSMTPLRSHEDMMNAIKAFPAGRTVLFRTLRRGRVRTIPVVLDARPSLASGVELSITDFQAQRNAQAQGYWEQFFEPLLETTAQATP